MSRKPRPDKGPRPNQGAHLLALRKNAGLTQVEVAEALDVAKANIANWEWSSKPPRAELLPKLADILGVPVADILGSTPSTPKLPRRSGPIGETQKTFEKVRMLPRPQQKKILEMVNALVDQYQRKAAGH